MGQSFRDREEYLLKLNNVNKAIAEFQQVCDYGYDTTEELEHLMMVSYRLWACIRKYMIDQDIWFGYGHMSSLVDGMVSFLSMQRDWAKNSIKAYPLAHEMSHLECISRASYKVLKRMGHIK